MSKTPQERYDEIKNDIIKISESYTLIRQNMKKDQPTGLEQRHIAFLHMRLVDLVQELNSMTVKLEIEIPLIYKTLVNNLRRSMFDNSDRNYKRDIAITKSSNDCLI